MDSGWRKDRKYDIVGLNAPIINTDEDSQHEYVVTSGGELDELDPADFGQRVTFRKQMSFGSAGKVTK